MSSKKFDQEFFQRKISSLTNERLLALLQLRRDANEALITLAAQEATERNMAVRLPEPPAMTQGNAPASDPSKLKRWNWGAFLLAPVWTCANKLDLWTVVLFIPPVNIVALFYLGFKGNQLAYAKNTTNTIDDFIQIQRHWTKGVIQVIWIAIIFRISLGLLITLLTAFTS
ncbi:hypothetical protein [Chryseolinea soli]|uniref:Uncharacterized protein n=1 Tax=Chryseolinea soli TaxID=2321403 RepID=A0A385SMU9_9BACT|nr:hypothetical protein [Chryseolinea soli]AYB31597.1 hypothetical protein D4L85_13925 [Chryseolinea soli]